MPAPKHVDAAVEAARAAFPNWSTRPDRGRKELLHALGGVLEANRPELMERVTRVTGKPLQGLNNVSSGRRASKCTASRWV